MSRGGTGKDTAMELPILDTQAPEATLTLNAIVEDVNAGLVWITQQLAKYRFDEEWLEFSADSVYLVDEEGDGTFRCQVKVSGRIRPDSETLTELQDPGVH